MKDDKAKFEQVAAGPGSLKKEDKKPFHIGVTDFTGDFTASQFAIGDLLLHALIPKDFRLAGKDGQDASAEETAARMMRANATVFSVNRSMMDPFNQLLSALNYNPDKKTYSSEQRGLMVVGEAGLGKTEMTRAASRIIGGQDADYVKIDIGAMQDTAGLISRFTSVIEGSNVDIFKLYEEKLKDLPDASQRIVSEAMGKLGTHKVTEKSKGPDDKETESTKDMPFLTQKNTADGGSRWKFDTNELEKAGKLNEAAETLQKISRQVGVTLPEGRRMSKEVPGELLQALIDAKEAHATGKPRPKIIVLDEYTRRKDNANTLLGFLDILNGDAGGKPWTVQVGDKSYKFTNKDLRDSGVVVIATGNENEEGRASANRSQDAAQESRFQTLKLKSYSQADFEDTFLRKIALPIATIDAVNRSLNDTYKLDLPVAQAQDDREFAKYMKEILHDHRAAMEATGKAEAAWDSKRELYVDRWGDTLEASKNVGAFMMALRNFEAGKTADGKDDLPEYLRPARASIDARVLSDQILGAATSDNPLTMDARSAEALKKKKAGDEDSPAGYTEMLGTNVGLALMQRLKKTYLDNGKQEEYKYLVQLMDGFKLLPSIVADPKTEAGRKFRQKFELDLEQSAGQQLGTDLRADKNLEDLLNIKKKRTKTEGLDEWQEAVVEYLLKEAERKGDKATAEVMKTALSENNLDSIITRDALEGAIDGLSARLKTQYVLAKEEGKADSLVLNPAMTAQLLMDVKLQGGKIELTQDTTEAVDIRGFKKETTGEAMFKAVEGHIASNGDTTDTRQILMTMALDKEIARDVAEHLFTQGFSAWSPEHASQEAKKILENRPNDGDLGFTVLRTADESGKAAHLIVLKQGENIVLVGDIDAGKLSGMLKRQGITYIQRTKENEGQINSAINGLLDKAKTHAIEKMTQAASSNADWMEKQTSSGSVSKRVGELVDQWYSEDNGPQQPGVSRTITPVEELKKAIEKKPERLGTYIKALVEDHNYQETLKNAFIHRFGPNSSAQPGTPAAGEDKAHGDAAFTQGKTLANLITSGEFNAEIPVVELRMQPESLKQGLEGTADHRRKFFASIIDKTPPQRGVGN